MNHQLNKETMRARFPIGTKIVEFLSDLIAVSLVCVGFVIGSAWSGLRAGFIIGRDV